MNSQIQSALNWRYATKLFNPEKKVPDADLETLLEAIRLAPSSLGLQPWKAYVITNKEIREKLKKAAYNQLQVGDASHLFVFATRKNVSDSYIDSYLGKVMEIRNQKKEDVQGYKKMIEGSITGRTDEMLKEWNARQTYIALGILLETAALMKIDACPMEGFDTAQFDTILGINKTDYASVVMAAIGYRSENDKYAAAPKVRFAQTDIIVRV